jgi:hypothetical protein
MCLEGYRAITAGLARVLSSTSRFLNDFERGFAVVCDDSMTASRGFVIVVGSAKSSVGFVTASVGGSVTLTEVSDASDGDSVI